VERPFEASIHGDRIYGLGAADTKLDFVAKALALVQCGVPGRDVWLLGTFGEEHGLVGAKELAASGMLPRGAIAMVGEPSHLQIITAHKGLMAYELSIEFTPTRVSDEIEVRKTFHVGKAAHSSTPALGENAITKPQDDQLGTRPAGRPNRWRRRRKQSAGALRGGRGGRITGAG
jgi:acetylornithine deacetylase/succinyl-diaminopimelate desuccinylase-like protein